MVEEVGWYLNKVASKAEGVGGVPLVLPINNFIEEDHTWSVDLLVEWNKAIFPFIFCEYNINFMINFFKR
jgi:hypothetical protein